MREWALKSQGAGQSASADIRSGGPRSLCQECRSPLHSEQDLLDLRSRYRSLAGSPQPRSLPWLTVLRDFARRAGRRSASSLRFPQKPGMSKECVAKVLTSLQVSCQMPEAAEEVPKRRRKSSSPSRRLLPSTMHYQETVKSRGCISVHSVTVVLMVACTSPVCSSWRIPSMSLCENRLTRRRLTNARNSAWPKRTRGLLPSACVVRCWQSLFL